MAYFDKDKVKFSLTLDDVARLLQALGGEPIVIGNNLIISKICPLSKLLSYLMKSRSYIYLIEQRFMIK